MSELKRLQTEFEQKAKMLQDTCPHTELTDWTTETKQSYSFVIPMINPINMGYSVKKCVKCDKTVYRKCPICGEVKNE